MNSGRTVFAQLMDLLPLAEFRRCVERYRSDYKVQSFSCLDQFLGLAFAQLTYRESLRDIETCLRAHQSQLYHMVFGPHLAQHSGQRQPAARLAHPRRFRPCPHRASSRPLSPRTVRGGVGADRGILSARPRLCRLPAPLPHHPSSGPVSEMLTPAVMTGRPLEASRPKETSCAVSPAFSSTMGCLS
jgi:Domain of unknown function (DUF4372)